jgi:Ca2+-binding EF-hand superfamily protein
MMSPKPPLLAAHHPANSPNLHGQKSDTEANHSFKPQASTNYKEAFSLFDKRGTGRVPLDSLGDLLRACGQNPTLAEIKEQEKGIGKDCK